MQRYFRMIGHLQRFFLCSVAVLPLFAIGAQKNESTFLRTYYRLSLPSEITPIAGASVSETILSKAWEKCKSSGKYSTGHSGLDCADQFQIDIEYIVVDDLGGYSPKVVIEHKKEKFFWSILGLNADGVFIRNVSDYNFKNASNDDVLNSKLDGIIEFSSHDPLSEWGAIKTRIDGWLEISSTSTRTAPSFDTYRKCDVQKTIRHLDPVYPIYVPELWMLTDSKIPPCKSIVSRHHKIGGRLTPLSPEFYIKDGYLYDADKIYWAGLNWSSNSH